MPKLQGALETITELLKGENILTGPQIGYSIFRESLESWLSLHFRVVFSNMFPNLASAHATNTSMLKRKSPPSLESSSTDGATWYLQECQGSLDTYLCALGQNT